MGFFYNLIVAAIRPVPTQEKKHMGLDSFPSCIFTSPDQKSTPVENTPKPMRDFNFVPIQSDPMLIFQSGNRPLVYIIRLLD